MLRDRLGLLAAAAAALALGLFLWRADWPRYRRLQDEGVKTDGWVVAKDASRREIMYGFAADDKEYGGTGPADFGNPSFEALSDKDRVLVFYLPKTPEVSCLGDPAEYLRGQNRILAIALIIVVPGMGFFLRRELARF